MGAALERVFGGEALGAVEKAAGNPGGLAVALAHAREALADVAEDQQASCWESLDKLGA